MHSMFTLTSRFSSYSEVNILSGPGWQCQFGPELPGKPQVGAKARELEVVSMTTERSRDPSPPIRGRAGTRLANGRRAGLVMESVMSNSWLAGTRTSPAETQCHSTSVAQEDTPHQPSLCTGSSSRSSHGHLATRRWWQ